MAIYDLRADQDQPEPDLSGPELLNRLEAIDLGCFGPSRLRMIQRELRRWGLGAVRALLALPISTADGDTPPDHRHALGNIAS